MGLSFFVNEKVFQHLLARCDRDREGDAALSAMDDDIADLESLCIESLDIRSGFRGLLLIALRSCSFRLELSRGVNFSLLSSG